MKKEQKEVYFNYLEKELLPKFNNRRSGEILSFLKYAKKIIKKRSYIPTGQGREAEIGLITMR